MRAALLCSLAAVACACQPRFDRAPSRVDGPRVLAVRAEPPEAAPGASVTLAPLLVDAAGPLDAATVDWAFCLANRPAADDNTVSARCLPPDSPDLRPIAPGPAPPAATAVLPAEGCQVFGSEPPPPPPGEPPLRPVDPDPSGGYYQPVRLAVAGGEAVAFAQVRLRCALPAAPAPVAQEFRARYVPNRNPHLAELGLAGGATTVAPGGREVLQAAWAPEAAEPFVAFDLASSALVDRVEALRVSWFSTAGTFDADRSAPQGEARAQVGWRAPDAPGPVHLWAVLRDDRGGMGWRHLVVEVR